MVIITIPLLILFVFSINFRFQFLNTEFWMTTFKEGNVYYKISEVIKSNLELNAVKSGGLASDVIDLSSLVSQENVKNFFEENIQSFLLYANGKSSEIIVSIPFTNDLWNQTSNIELKDLLEEYNIETIDKTDIQKIPKLGRLSWISVSVLATLIILSIFSMYLMSKQGKHLIYPGIVFTLSGVILMSCFVVSEFARNIILRDFSGSTNVGKSLLVIVAVPAIANTVQIWLWFGISFLILGTVLFFIKKPVNNQR